jgi:pimeloyl-ACP methyl ester carboxylesterase
VVPLLEAKEYKVIALDLPSHGDDTVKLASNTLADDIKAVTDAANTVKGKVILLGHSSGGVVISEAADILGPEKVDKLVYLDAFLPQNGESVLSIGKKIQGIKPDSSKSGNLHPERFIFTADHKSFRWNPALSEHRFYHDCSKEDIAFANAHLSWNSFATISTPVHVSDSSYGVIKKYYILCTQAKDLDKSNMVTNVPCEKVYKLDSSHSPFFSMPEKLVEILIDISH